MNDTSRASSVTTASAEEVEAARDAVPLEARPSMPMRHESSKGGSIAVVETSGVAAAEATGKLQVDNDAPPGATAGSG